MTTQISGDTGVSQCAPNSISADDFQAALFQASLTANGYQKLTSGLIIQWGASSSSPADWSITFPIVFPTFCLSVVASVIGNPASAVVVQVDSAGVSSFAARTRTGTTTIGGQTIYWIAIGY